MIKQLILITSFIITAACGGSSSSSSSGEIFETSENCPLQNIPTTVGVFTEDEALRDIVRDVVTTWNDEMGVEIFTYLPQEEDPLITIDLVTDFGDDTYTVGRTSWRCQTVIDNDTGEVIDYYKATAAIYLLYSLDDDSMYYSIAHELGHALGMDHTSFGIMQATINEAEFVEVGYENLIAAMTDYFGDLYE